MSFGPAPERSEGPGGTVRGVLAELLAASTGLVEAWDAWLGGGSDEDGVDPDFEALTGAVERVRRARAAFRVLGAPAPPSRPPADPG